MELSRLRIMTSLIKLVYLICLSVYPLLYSDLINHQENISYYVFLIFVLVASFLLTDLFERYSWIFISVSVLVACTLYSSFDHIFIFSVIPICFDILVFFKVRPYYGVVLVFLSKIAEENLFWYVIVLFSFFTFYYLIYVSLKSRVVDLIKIDKNERNLRLKLSNEEKKHTNELLQLGLKYETRNLEEMRDLSQKLHDKVGHSLSGSVFKLEAAKLLISKEPAKSGEILDEVIGLLRLSIDEIRMLLRKQRPADSDLGINKLKMIFLEFKDNYNIVTSLKIEGDIEKLMVKHWSVIIENTIEALTNSLKYASCEKIEAELYVFNKVIRYKISDDGLKPKFTHKGMGINGMEQRIYNMGGSMTISIDRGFEINMIMPLADNDTFK